jgi:hypothetical protein
MKIKALAAAAVCASLLSACGGQAKQESALSATRTVAPKTIPDLVGKPFGEARDLVAAAGIVYEVVGSDGARFTDKPPATAVITSTDPAAGEPTDGTVTLKIKGTQAEFADLEAKAAAAEAARRARVEAEAKKAARATRYEFRCSPTGNAITADDNQTFNSVKAIWAAKDFKEFESCDLYIDGSWHNDGYTLEPDESAVVKQMGADGGDVSLPYAAYADVLLLCALPPEEGWDHKYGENPAGPKVRAEAKAAVKMCPAAPFVAELKRVANGVPPAPKTTMEDGTYVVGKDIAAGTYQVKVPTGANGIHDCYWERTGPHGGTIANDFLTYAPQGPVVSVYDGEGFVSKSCGAWTRIG